MGAKIHNYFEFVSFQTTFVSFGIAIVSKNRCIFAVETAMMFTLAISSKLNGSR